MPRLLKPRALRPGATIGIAAPGFAVDPESLAEGLALWREAGFEVVHRDDLCARDGYLAGDDARRLRELNELVANRRVDAILCARGGYGCDRILDRLDPARFRAARKPFIGYSDITALLLWQQRRAGLAGFHGPMLDKGSKLDRAAFAELLAQLSGATAEPLQGRGVAGGRAEGRLVGGSLTMLAASVGTHWEIDTRGAILMLEDVGERPYRIDRMLQQLRGAGKLSNLAGVGVGDFSSCTDAKYPTPDVEQVLQDVLRPLRVPLVLGLPFGHVLANRAWPFGARATIDGRRGEVRVLEAGVVRG
ncbi:MAG TPA: LD-carboxypeptidase [Myxococcota bacterium]|nr:LD-carboxypeptidase [Myxococcota bacterium]